MSLTVTPITPQTTTAWSISTATAADVVVALNTVAMIGWQGTVTTSVKPNTDPPYVVWNILLQKPGHPDLHGTNGSWIISDGTHVDILPNADFIARYTADTPLIWDATTTAPDAAPQSGLSVHITCPAPTSANGPWTYSVRLVDANGDATRYTGAPTLAGGQLFWEITGLTATTYTGTIACRTQYTDAHASSQPFTFTAEQ